MEHNIVRGKKRPISITNIDANGNPISDYSCDRCGNNIGAIHCKYVMDNMNRRIMSKICSLCK